MQRDKLMAFLGALVLASTAQARITDIVIEDVVPDGPGYERVIGVAHGAVDPTHPLNAVIQDIELAPRNEDGLVEYSTRFEISRPIGGGNGVLLYEAVNRGRRLVDIFFGPTFLGVDSLPRARGYIIVWSGWQADLREGAGQLTIDVPVLPGITGTVRTEYIVNAPTSTQDLSSGPFTSNPPHKSYEAVSLDTSLATLTKRVKEADARIPVADWAFADCSTVPFPGVPDPTKICLKDGFDPSFIYELLFEAKDPLVLGLGFAATRDLVSFLEHATEDDDGDPNPIAGSVEHTLIHGLSQAGRYVHSFIDLGFNEDEAGRQVFDGANPILAVGRVPLHVRFGQPGRAYGQHEEHAFPGYDAPFTWRRISDIVSHRRAGLLDRCRRTGTCPKILSAVTSTEYWQGRASLGTTALLGFRDVEPPSNVRRYLFSSTQHVGSFFPARGICQQLNNPNHYFPSLRALLVALEEWVAFHRKPPKSRVPLVRNGTLVRASSIGFPDIPGVEYTGLLNELTLLDFGPGYEPRTISGILTEPPTEIHGRRYRILIPKVDRDGNEVAGVPSTTRLAPLGTYTGWNLRAEGFAEDELCGLEGSYVPFAETRDERLAAGDPRRSLEERYGDHEGYVNAVRAAAEKLVQKRLLLPQDAARAIAEAEASNVLKP